MDLTIPVDDIPALPAGASFAGDNDRAHVQVSRQGDMIYITGTCDSLEQQVEYYQDLYFATLEELQEQREAVLTAEKCRVNPVKTVFTGFIAGLLAGVVSMGSIMIAKRKNN